MVYSRTPFRVDIALPALCLLALCVVSSRLVSSQQLLDGNQHAPAPASASVNVEVKAGGGGQVGADSDAIRFEAWRANPLFVPPFDPKVLSLPEAQLQFVRNITANDIELFRQIADEAVTNRNKFAPSVKLMFKYAGKILSTLIRNRQSEQKISPRIEPKPEFFTMLANLVEAVLDRSSGLKNVHKYSKSTINYEAFKQRVDGVFFYIRKIIGTAPMGGYLKWDEMVLYKDEPGSAHFKADLIEEAADLATQFRVMGYESTSFVGRRIANLLRLFGKGILPSSEKDV